MDLRIDISSVSKFRADNYNQWRVLIRFVLQAKDCYDIVLSEKEKSDESLEQWTKPDGYANFFS